MHILTKELERQNQIIQQKMKSIQELVSIIVPVYNSEKSLVRCIDSILIQTYTQFELLLINDGSTDNSGQICDNYALKDGRVTTFHQNNKGVSSARNKGIEQAKGKYITFIDSDDWIEIEFLSSFFPINKEIKKKTFIISGIVKDYNGNSKILHRLAPTLVNKENLSSLFIEYNLYRYGYTVAKLYENDIIQNNNIRFNENISYTEDLLFMLQYIYHIEQIKLSSSYYYHYVSDDGDNLSLSNRYYSYESEYLIFNELKKITSNLTRKFNLSEGVQQKTQEELGQKLFRVIYSLYRPKYKKTVDFRIKVLQTLSSNQNINYLRNIQGKDRLIMNDVMLYLLERKKIKTADNIFFILFDIRYNLEKINKQLKSTLLTKQ